MNVSERIVTDSQQHVKDLNHRSPPPSPASAKAVWWQSGASVNPATLGEGKLVIID
jgi:hypothetical protein